MVYNSGIGLADRRSAIGFLDRGLMAFYREIGQNTRRAVHIIVAILPLMMLLVGSCRTEDMPATYGSNAGAEQFRLALFPDRVHDASNDYRPAAGYVSRARTFVSGAPELLLRLTDREIEYMFGKPDMQRRDADARIWQYRAGDCVVDFYFYGADKTPVSYVDARGGDNQQAACIKSLSRAI
jgi:hypothetical protein